MQNNLTDFTEYIRKLCHNHVDIQDNPIDRHFIELRSEAQLTAKSLRLPVVAFDKLQITYKGQNDNLRKDRYIEILFLDKCADGLNTAKILEIQTRMESICEDFINKMREDKKSRKIEFLQNLIIGDIQVFQIENKNASLYGAMMSFSFDLPYSGVLRPYKFSE
jgi:hypothetical protein